MFNGFFNKYPYTDFHELNLDFLLEHYQEIITELSQIESWISTHEDDYESAIARLTAVENELNTFEDQINAAFDALRQEQQAQLDAALASINQEVDAKLRELSNAVYAEITNMQNQLEQLRLQLIGDINELIALVNTEITNMRSEIRANNQFVFAWVENRIQELINSLPEILTVNVYNPYRGEVTDIQIAINDIYTIACAWMGLTAEQYDSLGLTAQQYDDYDLTAIEYDTNAYRLLNYPDPNYYMISPFTGELTKVKDVVYKLAQFHMNGLTAQEYDALDLTSEEYDDKDISAFNYDWFGKEILTA